MGYVRPWVVILGVWLATIQGGWASTELEQRLALEFVAIPAGSFIMGGPENEMVPEERKREKPRHKVTISKPFLMGKYEVTQRQWLEIMPKLPFKMRSNPEYNQRFIGDDKPVLRLSWIEAQEFVHRLNKALGTQSYRLPTEAEWEYAARAGTYTEYFFGDDPAELGDYAWFTLNSDKRTHPVGQKRPNPWGLYDIYGNAFEWVSDRYVHGYNYYAESPEVDPTGPEVGDIRLLRGGSWRRPAFQLRSANRSYDQQEFGNVCHGIRLVKEIH